MWYNLIIRWMLSSPIHGLLSENVMLISFKGRNSGKEYTIPVNYLQSDGVVLVTSYRHRTWWRNLREGVPVTLRIRGQNFKGIGESITSKTYVIKHLQDYVQKVPKHAKYFNVALDSDGNPNLEDIARAAQDRVGIRIQLKTS